MKIQKNKWTWTVKDPSVLLPWTDHLETAEEKSVKKNNSRSIFPVTDGNGRDYFVKLERKKGLLARIRNRFFSKAESEFQSGEMLRRAGIPCIEYEAWGRHPSGSSIVVSRALNGFIPAMEEWYARARFDDRLKELWMDVFFALTIQLQEHRFLYPDFHSANVMIKPETYEYALLDVYGIHKNDWMPKESILRTNLSWLFPLQMDIPIQDLAERLSRTGLWRGDSLLFLQSLFRRQEHFLEKDWKKRRERQILSGNSKFSHREKNREIRHSLWYERVPIPPESEMQKEVMSAEDAENIWLNSFRDQLFAKKLKKVPILFVKEGNKSCIFSDLCKKNSYFS